ncbi:dihydrofolate reductase family protein [Nocardioides sp. Bht2]|uniref:dihydrofolate reductase family protein n=1 Tax=Nocardioides sp. Bht2 TaxID=3392297 RepID=UPI0039B3B9EC
MAELIYPTNVTLDGFIEDPDGDINLFPVHDDVFAAHTELVRDATTFLYGRRLYEAMSVWETDTSLAAASEAYAAFSAAWQDAEKIVYSTSLAEPLTARTRIERRFDPAAVRALKADTEGSILIGGADLAGQALSAGLVDEVQLYVVPVATGGGKPGLPTGTRTELALIDQRSFANGVVLLRYRG